MRSIKRSQRRLEVGTPDYLKGERSLFVAEHLLANNREEIGRADGKASILLVGALTAAALAVGPVSGNVAHAAVPERWLIGVSLVIWTTTLVMLAVAVFPRVGTRHETAVTYFGGVRRVTDMTRLRRDVEETANDRLSWLLAQVSDTSDIVVAKYRCIRMAICLLGLNGALIGLALAL
ncbi:MAG TPA: Pycsar system effector family protein [Pseudonocardiaceae bacterium]|nr:Pycsar system effector family protein [Pseudonocardiaceae bacterium]